MPAPSSVVSQLRRFKKYTVRHLNFYRVHLVFFTFTPLIFSGIFYASNGEFHIDYIDCLFNCVSAMTVCGLATVDLSSLTPFQQVLLFIQMCLGSPVVISWMMVYIRRSFFARKFRHIVEVEMARRAQEKAGVDVQVKIEPWWKRLWMLFKAPWSTRLQSLGDAAMQDIKPVKSRGRSTLRTDMIRRVEGAPKLVDPSGWISEGVPEQKGGGTDGSSPTARAESSDGSENSTHGEQTDVAEGVGKQEHGQTASEEDIPDPELTPVEISPRTGTSPPSSAAPILRTQTINKPQTRGVQMARTQTVEFAATPPPIVSDRRLSAIYRDPDDSEDEDDYDPIRERRSPSRPAMPRRTMSRPTASRPSMSRPTMSRPTVTMPRTGTMGTSGTQGVPPSVRTMHRGFGGFPDPLDLLSRLFGRAFPKLERKLTRTVTIPRTQTFASARGAAALPPGSHAAPYITFEAIVGRNSVFHGLSHDELEELGGVEYRALSALLWIVASYHIGLQLLAFTVIAPYMSIPRWASDFVPPALHRTLSSTWYSAFQVVSSYTNTGMSLVDTSMVPFQQAYPMIVFMIILILAGNTAFPILLRLQIWILSKVVPKRSRLAETLQFLLDHPRRCFVYLFPSHQTWFLVTVLLALNATDWFFFLVLDIGNPAMSSIPVGVRFIIGLLQATAVRAAGFGTVSLSSLAPAVKVLYVLMMYVSVYPIAMSVRSTNVYEEKSLGVFMDDESDDEDVFNASGSRAAVWGRYLAMHARKQLSFDMWWLGLALFLVCIIERDGLENDSTATWFNIFNILFELVSAYGTVGLSLGVPYANFSFSGALRPLSKLIVCAVMLRGRHRGLPVAIDRAVMLPYEYKESSDQLFTPQDEVRFRARSRSTTSRPDWRPNNGIPGDEPKDPNRLSAHSGLATGADHRDRSPVRGRRARRGSVLTGTGMMGNVEEQTDEIVDEVARAPRGGLMA